MENKASEKANEVIDRYIWSQEMLKYLSGFTEDTQKEFFLQFPPEVTLQVGHNRT